MTKTAVVLFNLGGPDRLESVRPFLLNMFRDEAILRLPAPVRRPVAELLAHLRAPAARRIFAAIGGRSPLLSETVKQARALEAQLAAREGEHRVVVAMRYSSPTSREAARDLAAYRPDRVVLLPLYPQFSTTTTASSLRAWRRAADEAGLAAREIAICCYPEEEGLVEGFANRIRPAFERAARVGKPRVLFSAHGLPKAVVDAGDPYPWQVARTAHAVVERLGAADLDWAICYQSRIGPVRWIGPDLGEELRRAARDGVPVVVVPIAFVSEHSETLFELDVRYRKRALSLGVPAYVRAPALGTEPAFVEGLARLVAEACARGAALASGREGRGCPAAYAGCPLKVGDPGGILRPEAKGSGRSGSTGTGRGVP